MLNVVYVLLTQFSTFIYKYRKLVFLHKIYYIMVTTKKNPKVFYDIHMSKVAEYRGPKMEK